MGTGVTLAVRPPGNFYKLEVGSQRLEENLGNQAPISNPG
jgi:hypothetical protein